MDCAWLAGSRGAPSVRCLSSVLFVFGSARGCRTGPWLSSGGRAQAVPKVMTQGIVLLSGPVLIFLLLAHKRGLPPSPVYFLLLWIKEAVL